MDAICMAGEPLPVLAAGLSEKIDTEVGLSHAVEKRHRGR
jgi:hypothetical protein